MSSSPPDATGANDAVVAVVGGGPAGLMAAQVLATAGARVTIYDRMPSLGRKFLLAGRGGLNITHSEPLVSLLDRYGPARRVLSPAIESFDPEALRAWCAQLGETTFVGSSGRVFPASFRATPLLRAWLRRLDELGVERRVDHTWQGWTDSGELSFVSKTGASIPVATDATILGLGGASRPRTGSNGTWVEPIEAVGIRVAPLRPSNVGFTVSWSEHLRTRFAGTPLKNIRLSFDGREARGEAMLSETGIEGGAVYELSRHLREAIDARGPVVMTVDLVPDRSVEDLVHRLSRRRPKDSLATGLRRSIGLAPVSMALLREAAGSALPEDASELARLIKAVPLTLTACQPIERAISTAGGIALDEVDDTFMLRQRPGTFVAGEMLDWEAPTGGYLLQATFSTAVAAANGALAWLVAQRSAL